MRGSFKSNIGQRTAPNVIDLTLYPHAKNHLTPLQTLRGRPLAMGAYLKQRRQSAHAHPRH